MAVQWGPIYWPGIYDYWSNWPSVKFIIFFLIYVIFRFYSASRPRFFYSKKRLDGKMAIITGANTGIGKETAKEFARRGCRLILACRDLQKAKEAKEEILQKSKNADITVQKLDLGSFQSVRDFAKTMNATETKIDILIHNAACLSMFKTFESTDFIEQTMSVNYFSPFLLTHLLINLLGKSEAARIVFITSGMYSYGNLNLKNLNAIHKWPWQLYMDSKLAVHCFAQELAQRLKATNITVNCVNPGGTNTELYRHSSTIIESLGFKWLRGKYWKTTFEGCQSILFASISDELVDVRGKLIEFNRIEKIHFKALDYEFNRELWNATSKVVNLKPTDPKIKLN